MSAERHGRLATLLCFSVPLGLYALTAARSVQGGDAGEFGVIGFLGGVAHPPGYPLYSLLLQVFAHLPFGPLFWRVAMSSACCGAAASAVLFRVNLRLCGHVGPAALAALGFALSPLAWRWSGVPEVFSLHMLMCALLVLCALRLGEESGGARDALALGLTCGGGFANHQTIVLLAPIALWALVASIRRGRAGSRIVLGFLGGCTIGLSTYAVLPLEAHIAASHPFVWGHVDTVQGFVDHLLRRDYGTFRLTAGGAERPERTAQIVAWLRQLPVQSAYVFFPAALGGIFVLFRQRRGFARGWMVSLLLAGVVFPAAMNLEDTPEAREIASRFFLMGNLLVALSLAPGLVVAWEWLQRRGGGRVAPAAFIFLVAAAVPAFRQANWARDRSLERLTVAQVAAVQPGATVLGRSDSTTGAMFWVTRVLGMGSGVRYIDVNLASFRWFADANGLTSGSARPPPQDAVLPGARLDTLARQLAVFLSSSSPTYVLPGLGGDVGGAVPLERDGFLYRVVRTGTPQPSLHDTEARLQAATRILGAYVEPIDAFSWTARSTARDEWMALARAFNRAGANKDRDAALLQAIHILPEKDSPR